MHIHTHTHAYKEFNAEIEQKGIKTKNKCNQIQRITTDETEKFGSFIIKLNLPLFYLIFFRSFTEVFCRSFSVYFKLILSIFITLSNTTIATCFM